MTNRCGRIIRGKKPEDFLTLTYDFHQRTVMLMGPDGLKKIANLPGRQKLIEIGYTSDHLEKKIKEGNIFKLVTFPESDVACLATWDNVIRVITQAYQYEVGNTLYDNLAALKKESFETIERKAGFRFSDIDTNESSDPRFMTIERYMASNGDLVSARLFLYSVCHLRELFSGDGYTYTHDGKRGLTEYIIPNRPLDQLGEYTLVDIVM